jgi:DNA polymerase
VAVGLVVRVIAGMGYLLLKLPSGRSLAYPKPEIRKREPTREEAAKLATGYVYPEDRFLEVTYWGQLPMSTQWGRIKLYGAKAFENEVQAIAADLMSHGARVAEQRGMMPFALIHDQGLAMVRGERKTEDFSAALSDLPAWAKGLPLKTESKITPYYKK